MHKNRPLVIYCRSVIADTHARRDSCSLGHSNHNYVSSTLCTKNDAQDKAHYRGQGWLLLFLGVESDPDSSKHRGEEEEAGGGEGQGGGI